MYKFLMSTVVAGTMALATNVYAACGSISMADMNWPSATLMANVDKIILEEGYGCEIEMVAGATTTTFASMNEKGQPDVCLLYTSPSPRDQEASRMPSSA